MTRLHQYRGNRIITAPASEPVTATELRDYLRTNTSDLPDTEANALIAEARQLIEDQTGIAMIDQTWLLALDHWPSAHEPWWDGTRQAHVNVIHGGDGDVRPPRYPLSSISGVNVYDEDGNATAVTVADTFDIDTYQMPGRMTLQRGASWPVALRANNAIEITYIAGYGASASSVPAPLKRAVKQLAGYLYANRGDGCDMGSALADSGVGGVLSAYAVRQV